MSPAPTSSAAPPTSTLRRLTPRLSISGSASTRVGAPPEPSLIAIAVLLARSVPSGAVAYGRSVSAENFGWSVLDHIGIDQFERQDAESARLSCGADGTVRPPLCLHVSAVRAR